MANILKCDYLEQTDARYWNGFGMVNSTEVPLNCAWW